MTHLEAEWLAEHIEEIVESPVEFLAAIRDTSPKEKEQFLSFFARQEVKAQEAEKRKVFFVWSKENGFPENDLAAWIIYSKVIPDLKQKETAAAALKESYLRIDRELMLLKMQVAGLSMSAVRTDQVETHLRQPERAGAVELSDQTGIGAGARPGLNDPMVP